MENETLPAVTCAHGFSLAHLEKRRAECEADVAACEQRLADVHAHIAEAKQRLVLETALRLLKAAS